MELSYYNYWKTRKLDNYMKTKMGTETDKTKTLNICITGAELLLLYYIYKTKYILKKIHSNNDERNRENSTEERLVISGRSLTHIIMAVFFSSRKNIQWLQISFFSTI